jgi:phosphate transport system permease protein
MISREALEQRIKRRKLINQVFHMIFFLSAFFGIAVLFVLLVDVLQMSMGWLDWNFISTFDSRKYEEAGMIAGIVGSLYLIGIAAPLSFILGVATAIYLEEYAKPSRLNWIIQANISNLAGIPSIVYGLLGLAIFVRYLGFDRSVLSGALTLTLLILPVIIVASQEAIKAVPGSLRNASFALGAGKWTTTFRIVIPSSLPGMLTGSILGVSRALGETAPIIIIGAVAYTAKLPGSIFDSFTAMPIQIYNWTGLPKEEFRHVASAGIVVLMFILLSINALAIILRNKYSKKF